MQIKKLAGHYMPQQVPRMMEQGVIAHPWSCRNVESNSVIRGLQLQPRNLRQKQTTILPFGAEKLTLVIM